MVGTGQSVGAMAIGSHLVSYGGEKGVPFQKAMYDPLFPKAIIGTRTTAKHGLIGLYLERLARISISILDLWRRTPP